MFHIPEREKIALLPTYQKYRYVEEASSENNDCYDDEYDDAFGDRQLYNTIDFGYRYCIESQMSRFS